MRRLTALLVVPALAFVIAWPVHAKSWRKTSATLETVLRKELGLTQTQAELHRALTILDRERSSLEYTSTVLDHAGKESMRKLAAYRAVRVEREQTARDRGRALYKLARGGVARLAFEGLQRDTESTGSERIVRGRMLRFLVQHDLEELAIHRRAEDRASGELVAASRELQSLSAMSTVQTMQGQVLVRAQDALDPQLRKTIRKRRRVARRADDKANRANRALLSMVKSNWRELRSLRGLDGASSLVRPVRGKAVGVFGEYEDKVLRLPMVRNGVELAVRRNERVRAMADGRVVLVTKLPGYEDVVVIDHGGGQYTLTARVWEISVAEGDEIEAGAVIARAAPKSVDDGLGRTIYVELRHGEKPIDPTPYLKRSRRSK